MNGGERGDGSSVLLFLALNLTRMNRTQEPFLRSFFGDREPSPMAVSQLT